MSANFFLKAITFKNYRGLKNLKIDSFRRINLIGGLNGTGKSTLLESIFFILDRRGPIAITRPFMWRKVGISGKSSLDQLFFEQNSGESAEISASTSSGNLFVTMTYGPPPAGLLLQFEPNLRQGAVIGGQSLSNEHGLNISTSNDGQPDDGMFALPMQDGCSVSLYRQGTAKIPLGAIVTPTTKNSPQEDAQRFSSIVRANRKNELIKALSIVRNDLRNIQILQEGGNAVLFAELSDGKLYPFPMLGDGMQTLLSISLTIMNTQGGVVLLDEFESAIHYSLLADTWSLIARLANAYNCQIFVVTHSKECIEAAFQGVLKGSQLEDLRYLRLERNTEGIAAVSYSGIDLGDSLSGNWEVR